MENTRALQILGSIISWSAIALAASIPLFFWPTPLGTSYPLVWIYLIPKTVLLRVGALFLEYFGVIALLVYMGGVVYRRRRLVLELSWTDIFLGAFIGLLWLSSRYSLNREHALYGSSYWLEGFFTYVNYAVLFVAARTFGGDKSIIRLAQVLVITTIMISLYAIAEAFYPSLQSFTNVGLTGRSGATAGNAVILGAYLIMPIALITGLMTQKKLKGIWAALSLAALGAGLAAIVFTFSRGAWAALALVAIFLAARAHRAGLRPTRRWLAATAAVLLIAVTLVAFGPRPPQTIVARAFSAFNPSEPTGGTRLAAWRQALVLATKFPLFGTGIDNFSQGAFVALHKQASLLDKPHNFFLEILATMGIPALIAYLLFIGSVFLAGIRLIRSAQPEAETTLAGLVAAGGYLAALSFLFSTINNAPLFYVVLGFVAATARQAETLPMAFSWSIGPSPDFTWSPTSE